MRPTQKRFRKTAARLEEHGLSLMFLHYPNSGPGSLSSFWQTGVANSSPGRIDFQPAADDELDTPPPQPGPHAAGMPARIAGTKHGVPFGFRIINIESIELAASPDPLQKIQNAIDTAPQ